MTAPYPNRRIAFIAAVIFILDQFTKLLVLRHLNYADEKTILPGFFRIIHVVNTGAAWSMFSGNNGLLALVAMVALVALFFSRHHFGADLFLGQFALGLIFGGIAGNLLDRILPGRHHVIDFLSFYINAGGREHDFPAFNVADSAICTGVALVFLLNWKRETPPENNSAAPTDEP
jgi:signal peptidase II